MFAHGGVGDRTAERYQKFLDWKVQDCNSTQAEIDEKEREKNKKNKKKTTGTGKEKATVIFSKKLSDLKEKKQKDSKQ